MNRNKNQHKQTGWLFLPMRCAVLLITATLTFSACGRPDISGDVKSLTAANPSLTASANTLTTTSAPLAATNTGLTNPTTDRGARVRSMQLVTTTTGWVLTDKRILWTTSGGREWAFMTLPQEILPTMVANIFFLDVSQGWIVVMPSPTTSAGQTTIKVLRTHDGGKHWLTSTVSDKQAEVEAVSGNAFIDFIDLQHGWIMLPSLSSSNFSIGSLFRTEDGGTSWSEVAAPSGDAVRFTSPSDGWAINRPRQQLYATHDGGQHWQPQVPLTTSGVIGQPTYDLPTFTNTTDGFLPVTITRQGQTAVAIYVTHDGGQSWSTATAITLPVPVESGVHIPTAVTDANTWIVAPPDGKIHRTKDAGAHWQEQPTSSPLEGISAFSFATTTEGWAQRFNGQCAQAKTHCSIETEVLKTSDGGQTWTSALSITTPN